MTATVKVEHINPFVTATQETFQSMVRVPAVPGKIILVKGAKLHSDISGIIGLGGGAKGTVALSFPRLTALKTVSEFIGERVVTMDEIVKDAVGELANIIAGAAKKELSQFKIVISLPTVIIGENHEVQGGREVLPLAVPFECALGRFHLIVGFKSEV